MTRTALVAVGALIVAATSTASASALGLPEQNNNNLAFASENYLFDDSLLAPDLNVAVANTDAISVDAEAQQSQEETIEEAEPEPVLHVVKPGDSLTKIAKEYDTNWKRIFFKNRDLKNPDVITIGDELVIPRADEKLKKRNIPKPPEPIVQSVPASVTTQASTAVATQQTTQPISRGSSVGNTYYAGYCTWYAKSRRPDLPNNLGNADTWAVRAAAQGFATGSKPRVGAIAQQGMHVAYVESVNSDGTVTLSEMNYVGWNVVSSRRAPASSFVYIY
jgi:surface antigen